MKMTTLVTALFITGMLVVAATAMTDDMLKANFVPYVVFLIDTLALPEPSAVVRFTASIAVFATSTGLLVDFKMSKGGRVT